MSQDGSCAFDARLEIEDILSYLCTISFLYIVILSTYVYVMTQIAKEMLEEILEKKTIVQTVNELKDSLQFLSEQIGLS